MVVILVHRLVVMLRVRAADHRRVQLRLGWSGPVKILNTGVWRQLLLCCLPLH